MRIFAMISILLALSACSYRITISKAEFDKAVENCASNGGLHYVEGGANDFIKSYCTNGASFLNSKTEILSLKKPISVK